MNDHLAPVIPIWTLSTSEVTTPLPVVSDEGSLTPERLTELRAALAAFSSTPLVTLEAHPLTKTRGRTGGLPLDAMSPLAQELSRLVAGTAVAESGEVLYRMVVPAKFVAQVGNGLVKSMKSNAVAGGVHSSLVNAKGIVGNASFVPVGSAAAGAAGGTVVAGGAITVAAPLILLAIAVGTSAYADYQRQKAMDHITDLLEQLHDERLEDERSDLDGCRDAIDKATGLLLDRGKVGASLGLDSAVHAISTAVENGERRVRKWEAALDSFGDGRVDVARVEAAFPGVSEEGGTFRAHYELATLAIALKRRVVILQGVEAAQSDLDNPFENFVRSLKVDQQRIVDLEARIDNVLLRLSTLELRSPKRLIDQVMTKGQVDDLLEASYRLRALGAGADAVPGQEVAIEIEKHSDGTLLVLPAAAA